MEEQYFEIIEALKLLYEADMCGNPIGEIGIKGYLYVVSIYIKIPKGSGERGRCKG
jgi:hypothetical protein